MSQIVQSPGFSFRKHIAQWAISIIGIFVALDVMLAAANLSGAESQAVRKVVTVFALGEGAMAFIAVAMIARLIENSRGKPNARLLGAVETAVGLGLFFLILVGLPRLILPRVSIPLRWGGL